MTSLYCNYIVFWNIAKYFICFGVNIQFWSMFTSQCFIMDNNILQTFFPSQFKFEGNSILLSPRFKQDDRYKISHLTRLRYANTSFNLLPCSRNTAKWSFHQIDLRTKIVSEMCPCTEVPFQSVVFNSTRHVTCLLHQYYFSFDMKGEPLRASASKLFYAWYM